MTQISPNRSNVYRPKPPVDLGDALPKTDKVRPSALLEAGDVVAGLGILQDLSREVQIGETLGKYLVCSRIGFGSSAVVYRGTDTRLATPVAMKFVRESARRKNPDILEEFRRESKLLARLDHPNIVRVRDFDDSVDLPHIVMEFIDGLTLSELLSQSGRLQPDKVIGLMEQTVLALSAAWEFGVVHRDLKPGNLMIRRDGKLRVTDFGLAAVVDDPDLAGELGGPGKRLVGTAAYMPPEQARRPSEVTHLADIYSLGATFFQLLTDRLPFPAKTPREAIMKHLEADLEPPHVVCPGVPEGLSMMVARMMHKKPAQRYQNGREILQELDRLRTPTSRLADTRPRGESGEPAAHLTPAQFLVETRQTGGPMTAEQIRRGVRRRLRAGDIEGAVAELRGLAGDQPNEPEVWLWLARTSATPDEALGYLQRLLALAPQHPAGLDEVRSARLRAARSEARAGRRASARTYLTKVIERDPTDVQAWLLLAEASDTARQARVCYRKVLAVRPGHAAAEKELARLGD